MKLLMTLVWIGGYLLNLHYVCAAEEEEWIKAEGKENYGTYCFVVMPDGRLLTFNPYYVLEAQEGYREWSVIGSHVLMDMEKVAVTTRGELVAGLSGKGIWKSEDGGKSWVQKSTKGTLSYVTITDLHVDGQGYIYACGESGIMSDSKAMWRSRDNGESWWRFGNTERNDDIGAMGWRSDGVVVLCGGNGIYRSEDWGENFALVKQWGSGIQGEDVEVHGSGVVIVGSNVDGGLAWRSDTAGKNFALIEPIKSVGAITMDSLGRIYVFAFSHAEENHYVFRSLDTGKTWQVYNSGRTGEGVNNVYDMITTPEGYVFTGGLTIHRTKNRTHAHPVFWGKRGYCTAVEYMVIDSSVAEVELVGEQSENVQFQRLSPLGAGKVRIRLFLLENSQQGVYTVRAVNATGVETLYHDTLRSVIPQPAFYRSGDTLWATGGYVYQWYKGNEKLEGERKEYVVLESEGVYRVVVENSTGCTGWSEEYAYNGTSVEETDFHRMATSLFAPVPNPSNGEVEVVYALGRAGVVHISIVDVLGRVKARLDSFTTHGEQPAGTHRVQFDGKHLPMGVYTLRMEVAGVVYSQPLVIVK